MKLQEMLKLQGFDLSDDDTRLDIIRTTRKGNRVVRAVSEGEYLDLPDDYGVEYYTPYGASSTDIVIDADQNVLNEQEALRHYFG